MEGQEGIKEANIREEETIHYASSTRLDQDQSLELLHSLIIHHSNVCCTKVALEAKMALSKGLPCLPHGLWLWQSSMQFYCMSQQHNGKFKVFLSSSKEGEPKIDIGEYKTLVEVNEVRKVLRECRTNYVKLMEFREENPSTMVSYQKKFYDCCKNIESCKEDFILFKALECEACKKQVHTECIVKLGSICLRGYLGEVHLCYECTCTKRYWTIVPDILSSMKECLELIQARSPSSKVIDLRKGLELQVLMDVLQMILKGCITTDYLRTISTRIEVMKHSLELLEANQVNQWIEFIDLATPQYSQVPGGRDRRASADQEPVEEERVAEDNKPPSPRGVEAEDAENDDEPDLRLTYGHKGLLWTDALEQVFAKAVEIVTIKRATPKRVLQQMNVKGLTYDQVQSHLQKYKRKRDESGNPSEDTPAPKRQS